MARRSANAKVAAQPTGPAAAKAAKHPSSSARLVPTTVLTDMDLISGVASWLETDVPHEHWVPVINLAAQQALDFPIIHRNPPLAARTLAGGVAETRPHRHSLNLPHPQDLVYHFASLLLSWVYFYRLSQPTIRAILEHGYYMAVREHTQEHPAA